MSYTARDIMNIAAAYYDETIDDSIVIYAVNGAINLIADKGMNYATVTITPTDVTVFNDTDEKCTTIKWVRDSNSNIYYGWESYDPRYIRFNDLDTYTILIRKILDEITNLDDTIDLHQIYKQSLVDYLVGFSKLSDDDMNPDGHLNLDQKFIQNVATAYTTLNKKNYDARIIAVRHI